NWRAGKAGTCPRSPKPRRTLDCGGTTPLLLHLPQAQDAVGFNSVLTGNCLVNDARRASMPFLVGFEIVDRLRKLSTYVQKIRQEAVYLRIDLQKGISQMKLIVIRGAL